MFTVMRDNEVFPGRMAVYSDMNNDKAHSMTRFQEETQVGHLDLTLYVGTFYSKDFERFSLILFVYVDDLAFDMDSYNALYIDQFMSAIEPMTAFMFLTCFLLTKLKMLGRF
jgi:hypothetical protein